MNSRKVALITGSATGLAKQTAFSLAKSGHDIVLNYRNSFESVQLLKQEVERNFGVSCIAIQGDVTRHHDCENMIIKTIDQFGRIDILVNSAGPYIFDRKKMIDYEYDEWNYIVQGNLNAVFYLCKNAIPHMRIQKWGRIINFGFAQAAQASGWIYRSAFSASKVGLVSLTKTLAIEEAEHGITVNMVCPGDIKGKDKEKTIEQVKIESEEAIAPIGRSGSGEDIGRVVEFLCSDQSDFITGSIIEVTGGFSINNNR